MTASAFWVGADGGELSLTAEPGVITVRVQDEDGAVVTDRFWSGVEARALGAALSGLARLAQEARPYDETRALYARGSVSVGCGTSLALADLRRDGTLLFRLKGPVVEEDSARVLLDWQQAERIVWMLDTFWSAVAAATEPGRSATSGPGGAGERVDSSGERVHPLGELPDGAGVVTGVRGALSGLSGLAGGGGAVGGVRNGHDDASPSVGRSSARTTSVDGPPGVPAPGDGVPTVGRHAYLSTSCLHGHHERCTDKGAACKFCAAACLCGCHRPDQGGPDSEMRTR